MVLFLDYVFSEPVMGSWVRLDHCTIQKTPSPWDALKPALCGRENGGRADGKEAPVGRGDKIQQGRVCKRVKAQERRRILEGQSQHHWVEALGFRAEGVRLSNALLQLLLFFMLTQHLLVACLSSSGRRRLDLSKPREIVVEVNPSLNCGPEQGTMH